MIKFDGENIRLDTSNPEQNYVQVDHCDFRLEYLNNFESNKGASSNIFLLIDPEQEFEDRVIKICKSPKSNGKNKRIARFKREISALRLAKSRNLRYVIDIHDAGEIEIDNYIFLYIVIEKAEEDLASFMERNKFNFTINQKLSICINILNGIKQLHSLKIYHRDIKHDNILRVGGEFKIGDLGLIHYQNNDFQIDRDNEKIGPFGWLSPEATNKMLTFNKNIGFMYDCDINYKSDIFQLGKLFWYIFQGNLPIGQLTQNDHRFENDIYNVFLLMLQYDKNRRPDISQIETLLRPLMLKYGV